ncbi:hypothetical protein F66182_8720 [Fusarium sp. NRRL 66182]|nr:hypothetical protein F66182_8720 [Fusarium sp. NRRL 66182]
MSAESLPTRALGKDGPLIPAMGLGLMGMSHSYGETPSDEERFAVLDRAVEIGATFWDTSDLYDDSQKLLAKWFKRTGKRNQIFLATKYGYVVGDSSKGVRVDSSYEYTKAACDQCLNDLGVGHIDLFYAHNVNPDTPIEETMRALAELKAEGKIRFIGLSTVSSATLRRAEKVVHVDATQVDYSVVERSIEGSFGTHILSTARELGVGIVCAMPLGRGLLTNTFSSGKVLADGADKDSRELHMPRFQSEHRKNNMEWVKKFQVFADRKGCTVSQLGLAWLLKQGDDVFPIPGTRQIKYLEQNVAALGVVLGDEEEREMTKFLDENEISGGAVPDQFLPMLYRDTKLQS